MCCQEPLFSFLQSLEGELVVDSTGDLQALDHSRQGPAPEKADPADGSARDLVEWIAGNDPSNNIREYAEKLLR